MQCHLYPASSPCSSERIGGEGARNENTPPNLLPKHRGKGSRGADASRHVHLPTFPVVTLCKPAKSFLLSENGVLRAEPLQQEGLPAMLSLKNQRSKACLLFYGSP